jgi:hypothetical protein
MKPAIMAALLALTAAPASASVVLMGGNQLDHDPTTLTTAATCQPQTECSLGWRTLPLGEQFGNANYTCFANQTAGATIPAVFEYYPQTYAVYYVQFLNTTGTAIQGGTAFNVAFTCYGKAGGHQPRGR